MNIVQRIDALKPRTFFLIDGIGALLSASMLGLLLGNWEDVFGMPQRTCLWLAFMAMGFAAYSFSCHFLIREHWRPFLKLIAFANLGYAVLTMAMVLMSFGELAALGVAYFLGEIVVIGVLVFFELRAATKDLPTTK